MLFLPVVLAKVVMIPRRLARTLGQELVEARLPARPAERKPKHQQYAQIAVRQAGPPNILICWSKTENNMTFDKTCRKLMTCCICRCRLDVVAAAIAAAVAAARAAACHVARRT